MFSSPDPTRSELLLFPHLLFVYYRFYCPFFFSSFSPYIERGFYLLFMSIQALVPELLPCYDFLWVSVTIPRGDGRFVRTELHFSPQLATLWLLPNPPSSGLAIPDFVLLLVFSFDLPLKFSHFCLRHCSTCVALTVWTILPDVFRLPGFSWVCLPLHPPLSRIVPAIFSTCWRRPCSICGFFPSRLGKVLRVLSI